MDMYVKFNKCSNFEAPFVDWLCILESVPNTWLRFEEMAACSFTDNESNSHLKCSLFNRNGKIDSHWKGNRRHRIANTRTSPNKQHLLPQLNMLNKNTVWQSLCVCWQVNCQPFQNYNAHDRNYHLDCRTSVCVEHSFSGALFGDVQYKDNRRIKKNKTLLAQSCRIVPMIWESGMRTGHRLY